MLRRSLILALVAGYVLVLAGGASAKSGQSTVIATVHQFVDGLNKGDNKAVIAACTSPASIIDDFAPHVWRGPTACADWVNAFDTTNKQGRITDGVVTLRTPWHVDVTGDTAYVVTPANYAYKQNGKPVLESGSILTVALKKVGADWRITGWAWAQH
jgi:ketosteroid isomerase-like protein